MSRTDSINTLETAVKHLPFSNDILPIQKALNELIAHWKNQSGADSKSFVDAFIHKVQEYDPTPDHPEQIAFLTAMEKAAFGLKKHSNSIKPKFQTTIQATTPAGSHVGTPRPEDHVQEQVVQDDNTQGVPSAPIQALSTELDSISPPVMPDELTLHNIEGWIQALDAYIKKLDTFHTELQKLISSETLDDTLNALTHEYNEKHTKASTARIDAQGVFKGLQNQQKRAEIEALIKQCNALKTPDAPHEENLDLISAHLIVLRKYIVALDACNQNVTLYIAENSLSEDMLAQLHNAQTALSEKRDAAKNEQVSTEDRFITLAHKTLHFGDFKTKWDALSLNPEVQKAIFSRTLKNLEAKTLKYNLDKITMPALEDIVKATDLVQALFVAPIILALEHTKAKMPAADSKQTIATIQENCLTFKTNTATELDSNPNLADVGKFAANELAKAFPHAQSRPLRIFLDVLMMFLPGLSHLVKKLVTGTATFGGFFDRPSAEALKEINLMNQFMPTPVPGAAG